MYKLVDEVASWFQGVFGGTTVNYVSQLAWVAAFFIGLGGVLLAVGLAYRG